MRNNGISFDTHGRLSSLVSREHEKLLPLLLHVDDAPLLALPQVQATHALLEAAEIVRDLVWRKGKLTMGQ